MKVNALCIPSSTPYFKEWIENGYTKKDIYKEYILNNYVLPDVPSKLSIEKQLILKSLIPVDSYQEDWKRVYTNVSVAQSVDGGDETAVLSNLYHARESDCYRQYIR